MLGLQLLPFLSYEGNSNREVKLPKELGTLKIQSG